MSDGFIKIHGKEYETVAHRLARFRADHPTAWIECKILTDDGKVILMRAAIGFEPGELIATGHAEEIRGSSNINKTSALENCETSAIGRALAAAGYESGGSIASADEVEVAVARQAYEKTTKKLQMPPEPLITVDQMEAMSVYLEAMEKKKGEQTLQKLLSWAEVDHLNKVTQEQAGAVLSKWGVKA